MAAVEGGWWKVDVVGLLLPSTFHPPPSTRSLFPSTFHPPPSTAVFSTRSVAVSGSASKIDSHMPERLGWAYSFSR